MGRKLHRKRRSYLRRRKNTALRKLLGWVWAAVILITGSFFAAKFLFREKPLQNKPAGSTAVTTTVNGDTTVTTTVFIK